MARETKRAKRKIIDRTNSSVRYADTGAWEDRPLTKLELQFAARLRRCPFCGGSATVKPWHTGGRRQVTIFCDIENGCTVEPSTLGRDIRVAAESWNRRKS